MLCRRYVYRLVFCSFWILVFIFTLFVVIFCPTVFLRLLSFPISFTVRVWLRVVHESSSITTLLLFKPLPEVKDVIVVLITHLLLLLLLHLFFHSSHFLLYFLLDFFLSGFTTLFFFSPFPRLLIAHTLANLGHSLDVSWLRANSILLLLQQLGLHLLRSLLQPLFQVHASFAVLQEVVWCLDLIEFLLVKG